MIEGTNSKKELGVWLAQAMCFVMIEGTNFKKELGVWVAQAM